MELGTTVSDVLARTFLHGMEHQRRITELEGTIRGVRNSVGRGMLQQEADEHLKTLISQLDALKAETPEMPNCAEGL